MKELNPEEILYGILPTQGLAVYFSLNVKQITGVMSNISFQMLIINLVVYTQQNIVHMIDDTKECRVFSLV